MTGKSMWFAAAAALAALWAPALLAQDEETPPAPAPKPQDPYAWVDRQVGRIQNLSDDQKKQIVEELKEMLKKIDDLRKETQTKIKEELGEETYKEVERALARFFGDGGQGRGQQPPQGRGPGGGGPGGGGFGGMGDRLVERAKEQMGLDDAQVEKFKELTGEYQAKVGEIFRAIQGQGREGFRDAMQKMQEELTGLTDKLKEGLSDEQKEKLDELMRQFRNPFGNRRGGGGNRRGGGGGGGGGGNDGE
jgi:Skp family chaperone for outer membrane proteins